MEVNGVQKTLDPTDFHSTEEKDLEQHEDIL